jgi:hypothetical protein
MPLDDLRKPPSTKSFSRDVVCVDLQGPELTDLSFIDLPGMSLVVLGHHIGHAQSFYQA